MSYPIYPYNDDPVPYAVDGDADTVRRFAQAFKDTAEALRDAATELKNLANENITISLAVDEVREKADEAQGATGKVAIRYQGAGDTLTTYKNALGNALDDATSAINQVITNNDNARYWRNKRHELENEKNYGGTLDTAQQTLLDRAEDKTIYYAGQFDSAMAKYNQAVADIRTAAKTAIAGLDDAAADAKLEDDFWEGLQGAAQLLYELAQKYLAPVLEALRGVLEILKSILDIICLIVSILAIFLPLLAPLAAALTLVSLALSAMILICSLLLFALGKETLGRVLGDAINLATGVITAKLGGLFKADAFAGLTTTTVKTAFTTTTSSLGMKVGEEALGFVADGAMGAVIGAHGDVLSFVLDSPVTLDLAPNGGGSPWGAEAPTTADRTQEGAETFGGAAVNIVTAGISGTVTSAFEAPVNETAAAFGDMGNNFANFGAVPST